MSTTCRLKKPARLGAIHVKDGGARPQLRLEVRCESIPLEAESRLRAQAALERYALLRRKAAALRLWLELATQSERDQEC